MKPRTPSWWDYLFPETLTRERDDAIRRAERETRLREGAEERERIVARQLVEAGTTCAEVARKLRAAETRERATRDQLDEVTRERDTLVARLAAYDWRRLPRDARGHWMRRDGSQAAVGGSEGVCEGGGG